MQVTVQLFGAFREFEPSAKISLTLAENVTVKDLRAAFDQYAQSSWGTKYIPALLKASAFANATSVLAEHDAISANDMLAVLPPVSGG